jgi:hypothetical protein
LAPICAQEPTVAQVSTMVFSPTWAPRLTKDGIKTAPFPMKALRRATAPGTARNPASRQRAASQPAHLESTLSHQVPPCGAPAIGSMSRRRNDSSTAFLAHWLTRHSPSACRSATRSAPRSSASSVASTASRASPRVSGVSAARSSQAASIAASSSSWDMDRPPGDAARR